MLPAQTISYLTNGIVRDDRCVHIESQSWFMKQLASQGQCDRAFGRVPADGTLSAQYELIRENAWDLSQDEKSIVKDAQRRQEANGWDDVRPALSTTVR